MQSLSAFLLFFGNKKNSKTLYPFIPWLLNSSELPSYGWNSRKRYTLRLLSMCLGRSTHHIGGKAPPLLPFPLRLPSIPSSIALDSFFDSFYLIYTYVLAKILQNDAKFIQKLTRGFKNHMRNLGNFRPQVESPKSWNLMGYFCPKNTFVQVKCRGFI